MGVNASASAQGRGGISLGGNLDLGQLGLGSPAIYSALLFFILLAIVVVVALSLR
jgi:hypothetical protein